MSENTSYTITFVPDSEDDLAEGGGAASLSLEQISDGGEDGYKACRSGCEASLTEALGTSIIQLAGYTQCLEDCSEENCDPTIKIEIKAVKYPFDLNYRLEPTYGTLGPKTTTQDNYAQSFDIALDSELSMGDLRLSSVSASWEGNVRNSSGDIIKPPGPIEYDDNERTLTWGGISVVGTLRVTAIEGFDTYILTIIPREDSADSSAYSSTVRGFYESDGNPKMTSLKINEPNEITDCWGGGSNLIVNPDDPEDEQDTCYRRVYVVDPCTGEITDEFDEEIVCPTEEDLADLEGGSNG